MKHLRSSLRFASEGLGTLGRNWTSACRALWLALTVLATPLVQGQSYSTLVFPGPDGRLQYVGYANHQQTSTGNLIIDFSEAGYRGGGVPIPWVPVVLTLNPIAGSGDDHARIQAAIDQVSALPLSPAGFRGTLLLRAGEYRISDMIKVSASGVVIRGEGQAEIGLGGTVVRLTSRNENAATDGNDIALQFSGSTTGSAFRQIGEATEISDSRVPSGVKTFAVNSAADFSVGDRVIVMRTPTQAWVDSLEMTAYGWVASGYWAQMPRVIAAINGNTITLNAPVVHAIETADGGGQVYRYETNGYIENVGVENIRFESIFAGDTDENHGWDAVSFSRVENGWARQVSARYFAGSCVTVKGNSLYITAEDCSITDYKSQITGGRRYGFNIERASSYILMQRCYARSGRHDFVTGSNLGGPNVFLDGLAEAAEADIGPHQRYALGVLFDNIKGKQIWVQNRKEAGSGHGWVGAQIVTWNSEATESFIVQTPKRAMNFLIGSVGPIIKGGWSPNEQVGITESHGTPVTPRSLYYAQLKDRLGEQAVRNVVTLGQLNGTIWNSMSAWRGRTQIPWLPALAPLKVEVMDDTQVAAGKPAPLWGVLRYPLPSNYSTKLLWRVVSGPGEVHFSHPDRLETEVAFGQPGSYVLELRATQQDPSVVDPLIYSNVDTISINVFGVGSIKNPANYASIGSITSSTAALTFNTDTLQVTGGVLGQGQLVANPDGSLVAVFGFDSIHLTTSPVITGSRPLVLSSRGNFRVDANISVRGGSGGHGEHGLGSAGGNNGGDAIRNDITTGNPTGGQGPGGSQGAPSTTTDTVATGGGGFGGSGGDSTRPGGTTYGAPALPSLVGGSGAGGTRNKGGGAGGGGLGLVAAGDFQLSAGFTIDARGGDTGASDSQLTAGGGSGGAILISARNVQLNGTCTVNGGNGGNASGAQANGGGGGGGRIAILRSNNLNLGASLLTANGGIPLGSNAVGKVGGVGTVYTGLNDRGLADQWLTSQTGKVNPTITDWLDDLDHDGQSALAEYALGGSATAHDGALIAFSATGGGQRVLKFNRRTSGIDPADYVVETSTTLAENSWHPYLLTVAPTVVPHPTLAGFEQVSIVVEGDGPRQFFRVRIRY